MSKRSFISFAFLGVCIAIAGYIGCKNWLCQPKKENEITMQRVEESGADLVNETAPKVALTFDDGPSIYTEQLLEGLKARNVKATFFLIGKYAQAYPEIVKREAEDGHLIGNHTFSHVQISKLSIEKAREEIGKTNEILEKLTGRKIEYVRPPFGIWEEELEDLQMHPTLWSVDPLDWTTKNTDEIVNRVVTKVKENDIILMHDCYNSSVEAALRIIDILREQGYEFVTVDELILD